MDCKQCGHCCTYCQITIPADEKGRDEALWFRLHGCRTLEKDKSIHIHIPITCQWLAQDRETKKYYCANYENRPNICKKYLCPSCK